MSWRCPNSTRHKRLGPGGGMPGCQGRVETVILVAVAVPTPRVLRGSQAPRFEDAVPAKVRRSGVRIAPADLAAAFASPMTRDYRCNRCGWSLRSLMAHVSRICRKRRRAA